MKEWVLGITDHPPSTWKHVEPLWQDEKLVATSADTFLDVMEKLCETAINSRREYENDGGIGDHLWNMKIKSRKDIMMDRHDRLLERLQGEEDSEDGEDDSEDWDEDRYRGTIVIRCPQETEFGGGMNFDDEFDAQKVDVETKLNEGMLPPGHIIEIMYDYGSSTYLYLQVLSVKLSAVRSLLQYFTVESKTSDMIEKMKSVPAYNLPKEKQVDHYFPNASRAFLGFYVPLFNERDSDSDSDDLEYSGRASKKVISCTTLGLSSCVSSEEDITFCSMQDRTASSDLLFCPGVFDPDELLQAAEKAWEPCDREEDPHNLKQYRYDYICRWMTPADDDQAYERVSEYTKGASVYGPKILLFRLPKDRKVSPFSFQSAFPKTYEMLRCGKFRWFQYKKDVLRVLVGRGMGHDHRQFESSQILATWKYDFKSFHELLCAVEASWVWKGKEMTGETVIPKFDTDLGPSRPRPKEPKEIGSEKDSVMISKRQDLKKLVTALAISEDPDGKTVLYSGHDDGTLSKWSMEDNEELWSRQVYKNDDPEQRSTEYTGLSIRYVRLRNSLLFVLIFLKINPSDFVEISETFGVAGLAVRPNPKEKGKHLLYTWTDGTREGTCRTLNVWSGADGELVKKYTIDLVGKNEEGFRANPDISTVLFCRLRVEDRLVDSVLVGLHCICSALKFDNTYSKFNLQSAQDHSEGNIIPFYEHSSDGVDPMETWRGHQGMIKAMAVIDSKYLLSCSIQHGTGNPDAMILWSLYKPGVPLHRIDFWDPKKPRLSQSLSRLCEPCGISVDGTDVLVADEYGRRVVVFTLEESNDGGAAIKLHGYANTQVICDGDECFHGRMAMSRSHAVLARECESTALVFKIKGNSNYAKLDREDGDRMKFQRDYDDEPEPCVGRELADGKVELPLWGGNTPNSRKRQKTEGDSEQPFNMDTLMRAGRQKGRDGLGEGGPITVAVRGKWLVAGFSNGTISKTLLPEEFGEVDADCVSANHRVSCCSLSPCEWQIPALEYDRFNEGQVDYGRQRGDCVVS